MTWTKTGNIRGPQGPQGPPGTDGAPGEPGPPGQAGTGITFKGQVANQAALPGSGNQQGDAYLVQEMPSGEDPNQLAIWDGTAWTYSGSIQGPQGVPGQAGASGARGSLWHSITGDPVAVLTAGNQTGDQALDTASGDVWQWAD